jgi:hypothetical protein
MTPAQVLEVERICLGAAILQPGYLDYLFAGLTPNHFTLPAYRQLFALLKQRRAAGQWCHPEQLCEASPDWRPPEPIASLTYLRKLREEAQPKLNHISRSAQLLTRRLALGKTELSNKPQATSLKPEEPEAETGNKLQATSDKQEKREASFQFPVSGFQPDRGMQVDANGEAGGERETGDGQRETALLNLAEVKAQPVDWVWEPYLSTGTVALLSGDPGVGKTYLALAIAAQISHGLQAASENSSGTGGELRETRHRRGEREAGNVLYVGGTDSPAQVLRPRFDALGGDPTRLHLLRLDTSYKPQAASENSSGKLQVAGNKSETTNAPAQSPPASGDQPRETPEAGRERETASTNRKLKTLLARLDDALQQTHARLVIVDPLESVLAALGIGPRSQKLRRLMDQFVQLAEEHQCCVLLVRNISRSATGKATAHALGSLELTGVVRSHLLAGGSPDHPEERALVQMKSNLSALAPALGYTIDSAGVFHWTGVSQLTEADLLSPLPNAETTSAQEEAEQFLRVMLADGAKDVSSILRDAKELMIAPITLQRAKRRLGVVSKKYAGLWQWEMPTKAALGKTEADASNKLQAASPKLETPEAGRERETGDGKRKTNFNDHLELRQEAVVGSRSPRLRSGQALVVGKTDTSFEFPPALRDSFQKDTNASSTPSS